MNELELGRRRRGENRCERGDQPAFSRNADSEHVNCLKLYPGPASTEPPAPPTTQTNAHAATPLRIAIPLPRRFRFLQAIDDWNDEALQSTRDQAGVQGSQSRDLDRVECDGARRNIYAKPHLCARFTRHRDFSRDVLTNDFDVQTEVE